MNNEKWNVSEIFYSIAGEGSLVGLPMIFIRLAGCNLRCDYCDSKYTWEDGREMSWQDIYDEIVDFPCRNVCITGGEPYLQNLTLLTQLIKESYSFISIETNGTIYQPTNADLVVISPKTIVDGNFQPENNNIEFKYVITSEKSFGHIRLNNKYPIWIQPVDNNPEIIKLCIAKILDEGRSNWRLSLQIQKIVRCK